MSDTDQEIEVKIKIPDGLDFDDLKVMRDKDGEVCCDGRILEVICQTSGLEISHFSEGPPENLWSFIEAWYLAHRRKGGPSNSVVEEMLMREGTPHST